jgi:hypothetical protein
VTQYWARITGGGFWGWTVEILSRREGDELALTMTELPSSYAWTERGARRKAARMLRRRYARDRRAAAARTITIGEAVG